MSLGNLVANLGVNRKGWTSGLKGGVGDLRGFSSSVKGLLGPLAGIVGGTLAAGASISAAREQINAEKKLAAVLKATGGAAGLSAKEIGQFAGELQGVTNFGDEATIAGASVLATFKNIKGDIFKDALVSMQDMSAVLGTDLKGGAIQLGKALNDPIKGITALSRAGVSFTEDQKSMIRTLQEGGDMMGAQKIILAELEGEFGGAAKATADPMTQMMNIVGDVAEVIGFVLLPSINAVSSAVSGSLGPITGNVDAYKELGESIAGVVTKGILPLVAVAKSGFELITTGADLFSFAISNAGDLSQLALIEVADGLLGLLPVSENTAATIAANLIAGFAAAKAGAWAFLQNVTGGLREIMNMGKAVAAAIAAAFKALVSGENPLKAFADGFIDTLANQKDVTAPNIAKVMSDTFATAKKQTEAAIGQKGGVGGFLDDQREQIHNRINAREAAGKTDLGEIKFQVPDIEVATGGDADGAKSKGVNTALDAKSAGGIAAILGATQGGTADIQKKQAAHLEQLAKIAARKEEADERAQRNAERANRTKVVKL